MKRRYCKRQTQAAKITVLTSGIFLIVLWMCYFKFEGIFKQSDLVPEQMPFVNYFTSEEAENSTEITDMEMPLIEWNTSQSATAKPFDADSNVSTDQPVTSNAMDVLATATKSETHKPSKSVNGDENAVNERNPSKEFYGEVSAVADINIDDQAHITTTLGTTTKYGDDERSQDEDLRDQVLTNVGKDEQTTVTIEMRSNSDINNVSNLDSEGDTFSTHSNFHAESNAVTTESRNVTREMIAISEHPSIQPTEYENEKNIPTIHKTNTTVNKTGAKNTKNGTIEPAASDFTSYENATSQANFEEPSSNTEYTRIDYTNVYNYHPNSSQVTESTTDRNTFPRNAVSEAAGANNIIGNDQKKLETNRYVDMPLYLDEKTIKYTILLWNTAQWINIANTDVNMAECHYTNCRITTNRQHLSGSSAVVLQVIEDVFQTDAKLTQHDRNPNQVWVFQSLSQPVDVEIPESFTNTFNWSWSYRLSADIFQPFGALFKRNAILKKSYTDIFRSKKESAVWYSNECDIPHWIQHTVDALRSSIQIDIYTPCSVTFNQDIGIHGIINDYKFYLGFENYLCDDFMTEQFFQYLDFDVVLVAFGWVHNEYLPDDIFLNASEFPSLAELGEYLAELASSEEAYITFLKNKDKYTVKDKIFTYRNALCNLCDRLNNKEQHMRVYSVDQMYESLGKCS